MDLHQFEDTIKLAERMATLDSNDEKIFGNIALCYQNLKKFDQAINFYNPVLKHFQII